MEHVARSRSVNVTLETIERSPTK